MTRVAEFGPFIELEPGVEDLVRLSESGVARAADVRKAVRVADQVPVVVLDVDAAARRIPLSVTAVQKTREAEDVREYSERAYATAPERLGSLANKLRNALNKPS